MSMDQATTGPQTPTTAYSTGLPGATRPRTRSRGISFKSDKSVDSEGKPKVSENPQDKARRDSFWRGASKANPNAALNEDQPNLKNVLEESTLQNIRAYDHKDTNGNVIADPDLSNPTRPRLERPLDTIRSFEKAIDDGYKRRNSYMKGDGDKWDQQNQFASRRSSYFGGYDNGPSPGRQQGGGGGYYGNQNGYGGGQSQRMRYGNRMQSDPAFYQRPYPQHGHHQSHDTVNTGMTNGSDSTGPWASGTDPSSENSSIDRGTAMNNKPTTPMDGYGPNGYNGPIMEEQGQYQQRNGYGQENGYGPRQNYQRSNSSPMSPSNGPRRPIPLGQSSGNTMSDAPRGQLPSTSRAEPEKRKSWLKRAFSKKE